MKNKLNIAVFGIALLTAIFSTISIAQIVTESKSVTSAKERRLGYIAIDFNDDATISIRGDLINVRRVEGKVLVTEAAKTIVLSGAELELALKSQDLPQPLELAAKLATMFEAEFSK